MATTINAANISVGFDASKLKAGAELTRTQIQNLRKDIKPFQTEAQVSNDRIRSLEKALAAGAIGWKEYSTGVARASEGIQGFTRKADKAIAVSASLGAAVGAVFKAGFGQRDSMDAIAKSARTLGESYTDVVKFSYALSEVAGLSFEESAGSLKTLQSNIGMAAIGMGKAQKIFKELNLDAVKLSQMGTIDAFQVVADAIGNMDSAAERASVSMRLFGDPRIATALGEFASSLTEARQQSEAFVFQIGNDQVENVEKMNDQLARFGGWWTSFKQRLMADIAPGTSDLLGLFGFTPANLNVAGAVSSQVAAIKEASDAIESSLSDLSDPAGEAFASANEALRRQIEEALYGKEAATFNANIRGGMSDDQARLLQENQRYLDSLKAEADLKAQIAEQEEQRNKDRLEIEERNRKEEEAALERMSQAPSGSNSIKAGTMEAYKQIFSGEKAMAEKQLKVQLDQLKTQQTLVASIDKLQPVRPYR